jgi:hypothetical protein
MEDLNKKIWDTLSAINVNEHVQKKMNSKYLSWAWAWGTLMSHYPSSSYEFKEPVYFNDHSCEVWCTVTVSDVNHTASREMWLPVMDNRNNAIKNPNARDINDTRMRCLTKCLALFGLGHYIYAGEDIPQTIVNCDSSRTKINVLPGSKSWAHAINAYKRDGNFDAVIKRAHISEENKLKIIQECKNV